ncbi:MAG TPA: F0F1 ATP synthase subunit A [Candidatus Paceibacterota bacterium]|nr:F0F1 ATP synthase subunit A [Candidatus Paceibacterota bacterium]
MNRFGKIILSLVLLVTIFVADASAQPASPPAASQSVANPAVAETGLPTQAAPVLFHIGPLPVTNSMVCTWIVAAVIFLIVRGATWKNIKEVPSGMQNVIEAMVEGWGSLMGDILDPRVARWVFPFATTFFIFIIMCNFVDVIPGVGSIGLGTPVLHSSLPFAVHIQKPFFRPPTTDANLTVAMAGLFLVMSLFWAVRYNGIWGLTKHIFGVKVETNKWLLPLFLVMFIFIGLMDLVSILFARPVALAMRLYGNIFAGSTILDMTFHMKSWFWSILLSVVAYGYDAFECLVQAFVFAILVVAFVGTMCSHTEESGH